MAIRRPKDFYAGIFFAVFAAFIFLNTRGLSTGTLRNLGPGFFPMLLAPCLGVIGAVLVLRGLIASPQGPLELPWRPLAAITGASLLFAVILDFAGLPAAIFISALVATVADSERRWKRSIVIALILCIVNTVLFVYLLQQPISVTGRFGEWVVHGSDF
jgi:putative tricarboxylic transport membrane protein